MPYIDPARYLHAQAMPETPGELNFAITMLVTQYMHKRGLSYSSCNDCIGALEGAKFEFYRRVVAPYEDKKRVENGDVYGDLAPGTWRGVEFIVRDDEGSGP